ncbi:MAG TPA: competence/damage-inducible protein A [Firmicutes bacterium]|nr:competence/damage-inducible protein A [Bacillota bacterium]
MEAEILAVGTEILLGDILNTNAQYLSKQLASLGIDVHFQTVVGDNEKRLTEAVNLAFSRADLIITSGGLGPTEDDLTKETCTRYFGEPLVEDQKAMEMMEEFFQGLKRTMTDNNKKQAMVPRGCTVMYNENGTAPGIIQEGKGKILMMFPGPPRELIPMFETYAKPYLAAKQDQIFVSRVLRISKVGESEVEHLLQDIIDRQTNPTIATYVKRFEVIIRLTAKAKNEQEANRLIDPVAEEIHERLGINLYAEGETSVAEVVSKMLLERKETIAVAESLTGGMVASALVDYPGISASFLEGAVTYSNEAKMRRLGVKEETLQKYGAVSAQTAAEMAIGIAKTSGAGIGLSTTGIAGPGGGSAEKPVGTVYLGLWYHGKVKTKLVPLVGNRERIRIRAMEAAFDWLRRTMLREEAPQGEEEKANG